MKILFSIIIITSVLSGQSFNQKFQVESQLITQDKTNSSNNKMEYSVFSKQGNMLYVISNETEYDIPYAELKVFDSGESVLLSGFHGALEFYNIFGVKIKSFKIRPNIPVDYERGIRSAVSGTRLVILFNEPTEEYSILQKYSSSGILESELRVEMKNINGLAYSSNKEQIFLSRVEWEDNGFPSKYTSLINNDGQILKEFNFSFEKGFFFKDNTFVGFSKKELIVIDSERLSATFNKQAKKNYQFINVIEENNMLIAVSAKAPKLKNGEWHYQNPIIQKFDMSGNLIDERILEIAPFTDFQYEKYSGSSK